jgi:molybdopterin molybdotransferase
MPEFLHLLPPDEALTKFLEQLPTTLEGETVPTERASGRVAYQSVRASHPLPEFTRSTVDGYAVRATDTHGARESLPAYLALKGEIPMGARPTLALREGECALIHTGGMLPQGADAVVMVEYTQTSRPDEVEILRSVAGGENVIEIGEDVTKGEEIIPRGTLLQAAEIGGLMALGLTEITVAQKPRVGILSSGDEVIPPDRQPSPGQVRDVNTYTLTALVQKTGGIPVSYGIIADERAAMTEAVSRAQEECDLVVVTAGSSASTRDLTAEVIAAQGAPGVLVHGVNVRPGKPTILGVANGTGFIGLPGNPVSALVIAGLFVAPTIQRLLGRSGRSFSPGIQAELALNLSSQTGREDWVPVKVRETTEGRYLAEPVFGKSNLIFILSRADGLIRIPPDAGGLAVGETVLVHLFDN